ncbi:uncharacterized protein LOC130805674 [Amaranthus tricolor]|uniref:uncharacterized protein LOC130805674 n=1 Tax=Amaranthus tricolor TaxID=29722 RepID=UPI0025889F6A|nr:uncharacterized protein LOC130805674 [Amaranthus tricolor]
MATSTKIHPATLATNIKTYVPIQLDEEGIKFNTWVTLFKLHCRTNLVDDHLIPDDSSKPSVPRDAEWQHLDDIVRTWLYGTISSALLSTIVCPKDCALDTWNRIENNFKTIKLPAYCNELQNLPTTLNNLATSISYSRLALQLIHGLTSKYRTFRSLVQHLTPTHSFDSLRSMLELKEHTNKKDNTLPQDSALVVNNRTQNFDFLENSKHRPNSSTRGGRHQTRRGGLNHRSPHPSQHYSQQQGFGPSPNPSYSRSRPNRHSFHGPPHSFWNHALWASWHSPNWAPAPCLYPT